MHLADSLPGQEVLHGEAPERHHDPRIDQLDLFVEERAVPVRRMQHVDLSRGPIERLFGLATLVVFTAGNEGSAFRVPGLPVQKAQELRDRIVQMRGDGAL